MIHLMYIYSINYFQGNHPVIEISGINKYSNDINNNNKTVYKCSLMPEWFTSD